ncbi:MAG: hypothetical protein ABI895_29965 [Deltaproteobacteria bacterium]
MIEIVSPTRKPLTLSYRHEGAEVAFQEVTLARDNRRLLAVPAGVDLRKVHTVFVSGTPKTRYELRRVALMWDSEAESVRE